MDFSPAVTTLYLDVTHTFVSGLATGIQRVVRNVTAELLRRPVDGIDAVRPVVTSGDRFLLLDRNGIEQLLHPCRTGRHTPSPGTAARLVAAAGAYLPGLMDRMQRRRFARAAGAVIDPASTPAAPSKDDLVLLLDAFWGGSGALDAARSARRSGAVVMATAYDMIPVTHPEYMTPIAAALYARRMREAIALCDGFVAISRTTADALADFAHPRRVRTEIAYCGSDIVVPEHENKLAAVSERPTGHSYISVGTLEPRKGHAVVLDAFERLWAQGSDARLTFVGRRGWDVDDVWRRCRQLEADGAPFRLIDDADDVALAALLAGSSAAIVASETEGFGLPVVEALNRDLPVIASDIPIFREIAGEAVSFFTPSDPDALAAAVLAFERDPTPWQEAACRFQWLSWRDASPGYAQAALRLRAHAKR